MARAGNVDGIQVQLADKAVGVDVDEVQAGGGTPVTQEPRLHMLERKGLTQQRVIEKIDLADGEVVGSPPIGIDLAKLVRRKSPRRGIGGARGRRLFLRTHDFSGLLPIFRTRGSISSR